MSMPFYSPGNPFGGSYMRGLGGSSRSAYGGSYLRGVSPGSERIREIRETKPSGPMFSPNTGSNLNLGPVGGQMRYVPNPQLASEVTGTLADTWFPRRERGEQEGPRQPRGSRRPAGGDPKVGARLGSSTPSRTMSRKPQHEQQSLF